MSLRKSIDLSARNHNNNEIAFFLKSPDHVHNSFVLYVGYARFFYSDVFKGLASRESLFFWQMLDRFVSSGVLKVSYT